MCLLPYPPLRLKVQCLTLVWRLWVIVFNKYVFLTIPILKVEEDFELMNKCIICFLPYPCLTLKSWIWDIAIHTLINWNKFVCSSNQTQYSCWRFNVRPWGKVFGLLNQNGSCFLKMFPTLRVKVECEIWVQRLWIIEIRTICVF